MVEANEFYEPIFETNGDPVEHDIASPLDPISAEAYLRRIGFINDDDSVNRQMFEDELMEAVDCMYGCYSVIRSRFLSAAGRRDFSEMFDLLSMQYALDGKEVPITLQAIRLLEKSIWPMLAMETARMVGRFIDSDIQAEMDEWGDLEEDDYLEMME